MCPPSTTSPGLSIDPGGCLADDSSSMSMCSENENTFDVYHSFYLKSLLFLEFLM